MITHVGDRRTDVRHAILSMPGPVPGKYFVMAENGASGGTLEQFLGNVVYANDRFGELAADDRYALLQRAVPEGVALNLRWLEAPVHQLAEPQYVTCRGAALLAFRRLGLPGFDEFAPRIAVRRVYEPNAAHRRQYADLSAQFVEAFRATRPIVHALNEAQSRPRRSARSANCSWLVSWQCSRPGRSNSNISAVPSWSRTSCRAAFTIR